MKEIKNLPTSKYEIVESKDNLFRIFKDGEALVNPHGYVIPAIGLRAPKTGKWEIEKKVE